MTDRATCLRRLSDAPDVAPVANSPTEVLSVLSGAPLSLALFGEPRARLDKSSSGALSRAGPLAHAIAVTAREQWARSLP